MKPAKRKSKSSGKRARRSSMAPTVVSRYEAASQYWGSDRSYLPSSIQDARFDADASTRLELVRRSRYWEKNNAVVNKLLEVFENYVVGATGLQLIPSSVENPAWNENAAAWWNSWSRFPDQNSMQPLGVLQSLMARNWFVDGDVFVYKTFSPDTGRPRIQLIEGHRISTPINKKDREGKEIIDGVEIKLDPAGKPTGRPLRYWARSDEVGVTYNPRQAGTGTWNPIPADQIIQLFEPVRPGMYRGLPMLYPVMNDIHDLDDLQLLEMKAAKAAAEVANVVTNKTGEASTASSRRMKWQIQSQDAEGNPTVKQNPLFYEMTQGGRTLYFVNGEKFEQFKSDRPSVATQAFWDYLVRKICAGVGISALLVLPFSLQGTVTRADLDTAAAFFRSRSAVIAAVLREIYVWVMGWAVQYDRSLDGSPSDWWRVSVRAPRSVNVDVGRNSNAIIAEWEAGFRTLQDICGELGQDWRDVVRQKSAEAQFIDQMAKEYKVSPERISQQLKQGLQAPEPETPGQKPEEKSKELLAA